LTLQVDKAGLSRYGHAVKICGGKLDGLQFVCASAAQHADGQQRARQRGKEIFTIHRRVPPIGDFPYLEIIRIVAASVTHGKVTKVTR
jgi:hypothetical protein